MQGPPCRVRLHLTARCQLVHSLLMAQVVESGDPGYKHHNLHVIWFVTLMAVLGSSSVAPAFPGIRKEFGIWVAALSAAVFLLALVLIC